MASFKKLKSGWQYRISYKEDGKYKTKNGNGFDTKKEAQVAASKIEDQLNKGVNISEGNKLFTEYFQEWYETYRKGKNSIANDKDIEKSIAFAKNNFQGIKLKDIDRKTYQQKINEFAQSRRTSTVSKIHIYMKAALQDAIQEGIIYKDPTYRVSTKGGIEPKKEDGKYLNYNEAKKLSSELQKEFKITYISRTIILFALATGCRFAEALGLTWDCINFKEKTITINKTWDYVHTNDFSQTKNYQSNRTITIDDKTKSLLWNLRKHQLKSFLSRKIKNENNLVFVNDEIELISNSGVNKTLKKFCDKASIKKINFHGLRHTHASILLYEGINVKYVSKRLGHKKIETTLGTYQHVLDEMEQKENLNTNKTLIKLLS